MYLQTSQLSFNQSACLSISQLLVFKLYLYFISLFYYLHFPYYPLCLRGDSNTLFTHGSEMTETFTLHVLKCDVRFVLPPMTMSPYAETVVITMHTQAVTIRTHVYVIYAQSVSVLNEIKLRMLFCMNRWHTRSHTHFIISVCLSLFSLLAQANIFVFILQGNCFSSADLACGREKEKESSENGN